MAFLLSLYMYTARYIAGFININKKKFNQIYIGNIKRRKFDILTSRREIGPIAALEIEKSTSRLYIL